VAVSLPSGQVLSGGVSSSASPEELAQYCKACADCTKCKDCAICASGECPHPNTHHYGYAVAML
jgi:hypothetical protein